MPEKPNNRVLIAFQGYLSLAFHEIRQKGCDIARSFFRRPRQRGALQGKQQNEVNFDLYSIKTEFVCVLKYLSFILFIYPAGSINHHFSHPAWCNRKKAQKRLYRKKEDVLFISDPEFG